jgi:hypothetical protein
MANANHLGVGDRPSESHNWIPGIGWVFQPSFDEGESLAQQSAALEDPSLGFLPKISAQSLADAASSGETSFYSAPAYSLPSDVSAKIRARQASHDWYTGGMDHYNGPVDNGHEWRAAAGQWVNDRNGRPTISPWINTFDHDAENTFNRMREANYNPFLGSEGRWVGDEQQGIGELDGYNEDSIAAWFKNAFAGEDMVKHRREALQTLNGWNTQVRNPNYQSNMDRSERWMNGQGHGINKATERMTEEYFNQMGLGDKFGLKWQEMAGSVPNPVHSDSDGTGVTPTGMMAATSWLDTLKDGVSAFNENWNANRRGRPTGMMSNLSQGPRRDSSPEAFSSLPSQGMMKQDGPNRDLVYAKLMEKLGG